MAAVDYLGLKLAHGRPLSSQSRISLKAGSGLLGDVAENARSPRQVLVVRNEDREAFKLPRGYLRENICVQGMAPDELAPGRLLDFEGGAKVFLAFNCEPCKTIAGLVPKLKDITGRRGVLGIVVGDGRVELGAQCHSATTSEWNALSDKPSDRVLAVIRCIPVGRVVDYGTLLVAAGLQGPYFRVMPKYIIQALQMGLPAHRVVDTNFSIPAGSAGSRAVLEKELSSLSAPPAGLQDQLFEPAPLHSSILRGAGWSPSALDLVKAAGGSRPASTLGPIG